MYSSFIITTTLNLSMEPKNRGYVQMMFLSIQWILRFNILFFRGPIPQFFVAGDTVDGRNTKQPPFGWCENLVNNGIFTTNISVPSRTSWQSITWHDHDVGSGSVVAGAISRCKPEGTWTSPQEEIQVEGWDSSQVPVICMEVRIRKLPQNKWVHGVKKKNYKRS